MVSKLRKELNVNLQLIEIFKASTVRGQAELIKNREEYAFCSIEPAEKREYYHMSSAQKRLYVIHQLEPLGTGYNMPQILPLKKIEPGKLEKAFLSLMERHESLRTSFHMIREETVQQIHEPGTLKFALETCRGEAGENLQNITARFIRPFDLTRPPLFRVGLVTGTTPGEQQSKMMIDMHHIISDGASQSLLEEDFMKLYNGEIIPPLRLQYKDYSQWQNRERQKGRQDAQAAYWQQRFSGEIPVLNLPTDFIRPEVQHYEGIAKAFELSFKDSQKLKTIALEENSTLFMVVHSLFSITLSKLSGQEDIVIGTPTAGRRHADLEKTIGMFVNTLALRSYPRGENTYRQHLREVTERTLADFENQEYQFEDLVEKLSVTRDAARNPLFDVMLTMQNVQEAGKGKDEAGTRGQTSQPGETPEINERNHKTRQTVSKFDMTLWTSDSGQNLSLALTCNAALFKEETVDRFIGYFKRILSAVVAQEEIKLARIGIISPEEKKQVLYDNNNTKAQYPENKTIHRLFEEQAARIPGNIAAVAPGDKNKTPALTYGELNEKKRQLAHRLRTGGLGPGTVAAIMIEPSIEMITAILAVLKTGACYLPIDPLNPEERTTFLLTDSETKQLLTRPQLTANLKFDGDIINIAENNVENNADVNADLDVETGDISASADPVYMIYTSGTTGKPKGVVLTHGNLVNYVNWFSQKAALNSEDKTILTSSFAFDLGYTSLYPPLLTGAQLHLLPKETYMLPGSLLEYIAEKGITYLKLTPSLFSTIVADTRFTAAACRTLRLVLLGGEAINTADVEKAYQEN
ncbi:MAG: AMP-binding protein, partial [bacterium]|nr:AMP-binding protein [bacterium]